MARDRGSGSPHGPGRVYTVTYVVVDDAGNKASASAKVVLPRHHDHHDGDGGDRDHDGNDRDHDGDGRH